MASFGNLTNTKCSMYTNDGISCGKQTETEVIFGGRSCHAYLACTYFSILITYMPTLHCTGTEWGYSCQYNKYSKTPIYRSQFLPPNRA